MIHETQGEGRSFVHHDHPSLRSLRADDATESLEDQRLEHALARLAAVSPRTHDLWARMSRRKRLAAQVRLLFAYGFRRRMIVWDEDPDRRRLFAVKR